MTGGTGFRFNFGLPVCQLLLESGQTMRVLVLCLPELVLAGFLSFLDLRFKVIGQLLIRFSRPQCCF